MPLLEDDGIEVEVTLGGQTFRPFFVKTCEAEHEGEMESISDQCGYVENRRTGDRNLTINIEGLVTADNVGAMLGASTQTQASIVSSVYTGPVEVRNALARQQADNVSIVDSSGQHHFIYEFQLQMRQPKGNQQQ